MTQYGREDQELNLLMEAPAPRPGRRRFLQAAGLLAAAGAAGYVGGTLAGRGDDGAASAAGPPLPGNRRNERVLNIYNWSDYIDDQTIPLFQALTNIRVNYDVYSSNEDLLAKLRAGPTDYDTIVPTSDFIPTYRSLDLIEPLRQDLIPNMTSLDREFVETDYDPGNPPPCCGSGAPPGSASTGGGQPARSTPGRRCSSPRRPSAAGSPCCGRSPT
jgi:spermidine/putrescine transport system substrate-binding protein